MICHDIVVIGASSGGVEALKTLFAGLPADLPAAIFAVVHRASIAPNVLPRIFSQAGAMQCIEVTDIARVVPGRIHVPMSDHHLLLERGYARAARGPRENRSRPAIDPLFRSAARAYGPRVIGIILTGLLDDGTAGMVAIKAMSGITVVQDPNDAVFPDMPQSVIDNVSVDHRVPLSRLSALLTELVQKPAADLPPRALPSPQELAATITESEEGFMDDLKSSTASGYTCPDCRGALWEMREGELIRFRCHVGHAYSAETLSSEQADGAERALWAAVRALEENAVLARRLAQRARDLNQNISADRFERRAEEAQHNADLLRDLMRSERAVAEAPAAESRPETKETTETH